MAGSEWIFRMRASVVLNALEAKLVRKGRTAAELEEVVRWMTGYSAEELRRVREGEGSYAEFFEGAPALNPARMLVRGKVCGVEVSEVADPLMREVRILDKLVDDLAKGRPMERVLPG